MVRYISGWSLLALLSVLACVLTEQRVGETRRQIGLRHRAIGLDTMEEGARQRQLVQERHDRALGLLAPLRRPIAPELPTLLRRIPADVQVQEIIVTAEEWQVHGQRAPAPDLTVSAFTVRLAREETGRSP